MAQSLAALLRDPDAMRRLHGLAERYARLPRGSLQSRELVADTIADAYTGEFSCDALEPLTPIAHEIRRRAKRTRPRAKNRVKLVCIDDVRPSLLRWAMEQASDPAQEPAWEASEARRIVSDVRELASGDEIVTKLLDLYARGSWSANGARRAQIHRVALDAARERLIGYAESATERLKNAAPRSR